jgi:hypothetical protein
MFSLEKGNKDKDKLTDFNKKKKKMNEMMTELSVMCIKDMDKLKLMKI